MTDTANLALPCIEGSQAQKHVTHNDALRILDTLVQLAVSDRDLTAPPAPPAEGQRWIVKVAGTGAWAGHDNAIAAWQDGGWQFSTPRIGWIAFVADEGTLLVWNGTAWGDFFSTVTSIQNLARLGVGTTADATNPLSAKLNNILFGAKTVADGGDGHLRSKFSKESADKTLSLLFQDNYSGRAEIGLTGDDDLHVKVSADGSAWADALVVDSATGKVSFPVSGGPREMLTADRIYYVRSDGNDANPGLVNTSGGAFLTIQKAIDTVMNTIDLAGHNVLIQVAAGTYAGNVTVAAAWCGAGAVTLQGDTVTPSNVELSTTGAAITVGSPNTCAGAKLALGGFKITTAGNGNGIIAAEGSFVVINGAMEFGAVGTGAHMQSTRGSGIAVITNYTISGSAGSHWNLNQNARLICGGRTITVTGSPVFSAGFANAARLSCATVSGNTFSGTTGASSPRYKVFTGAFIDTGGAGVSFLPGDSAGTSDGTGIYA
jgi:hypothetical protein